MKWTKLEDQIIIDNYETMEKEELLSLLPNRTWEAILFRGKRTFKLSRLSFQVKFQKNNTYRKGLSPWSKGKKLLNRMGENNHRYKGYTYISDRGYKYIRTKDNSDNWSSYRPEHIVVIEEFLGRKIVRSKNGKGEGVHHIDGDKLNNDINNLILYANEKEHREIHNSLQDVSFDLIKNGIIKFNKETKKYYYEK